MKTMTFAISDGTFLGSETTVSGSNSTDTHNVYIAFSQAESGTLAIQYKLVAETKWRRLGKVDLTGTEVAEFKLTGQVQDYRFVISNASSTGSIEVTDSEKLEDIHPLSFYGETGGMSPTEIGDAIKLFGSYTNKGAWAAGVEYTTGDVWTDSGDWYLVLETYTSGASAAADIASGVVAQYEPASRVAQVSTIADLRNTNPIVDGQQIELLGHTNPGVGGGIFWHDASDTTTADDNGVTIVTAGGKRWKRRIDKFVTIEQMGYDGTNADVCIRNAAVAGLKIIGDEQDYIFSDTILIPKIGISLSSKTGKMGSFRLKAADSMSADKILIDTENYDYLYANSVRVTNPANPADISAPETIVMEGVKISGNYDGSYLPSPTQGHGIGVRLYGRYMRIDVEVDNTENTGILTYYPITDGGVVAGDNDGVATKQSEISIRTNNTGREGFVFDGPADSVLGDIVCRDASASNFALQDTSPVDSVEYPGDTDKLCPAIDIRKACHHTGFMNGFGTRNGWSTYVSNNRFHSSGIVQVDSSDGGISVTDSAWAQLAVLEVHGMTYGFIYHSGALRPAIKSESVQGFVCPNIKVNLGGNWSNRPIADIAGVGCMANINVAPIYADAPSNIGALLTIDGREHDVMLSTSGTLSGSSNKGVVFGALTKSRVNAQLHFIGSTIADFSGMSSGADKTNHIDIIGVSSSGNVPSAVVGLSALTSQDLKSANVTINSSTLTKDYSLQPVAYSASVAISAGSTSTSITHNYLGTPSIDDISVEFIPESTSTVMPSITDVQITGITGFTVTIAYTMTGGSGNMRLRVKVNA